MYYAKQNTLIAYFIDSVKRLFSFVSSFSFSFGIAATPSDTARTRLGNKRARSLPSYVWPSNPESFVSRWRRAMWVKKNERD